jgi:hypothetical protein
VKEEEEEEEEEEGARQLGPRESAPPLDDVAPAGRTRSILLFAHARVDQVRLGSAAVGCRVGRDSRRRSHVPCGSR